MSRPNKITQDITDDVIMWYEKLRSIGNRRQLAYRHSISLASVASIIQKHLDSLRHLRMEDQRTLPQGMKNECVKNEESPDAERKETDLLER